MSNFNKYIGLPYKNLGRDFSGVDCYGLYWLINKVERNLILPDYTELSYRKSWARRNENHIVLNMDSLWKQINKPYKRYDALLFYDHTKNIVEHIGTYISKHRFIHVCSSHSAIISSLDNYWSNRVYKVMRYVKDES